MEKIEVGGKVGETNVFIFPPVSREVVQVQHCLLSDCRGARGRRQALDVASESPVRGSIFRESYLSDLDRSHQRETILCKAY